MNMTILFYERTLFGIACILVDDKSSTDFSFNLRFALVMVAG